MQLPQKSIDKFWSKVDILDGFITDEDCWLWTDTPRNDGYGRVKKMFIHDEGAHRVSYKLYKGTIPKGLYVLHKCDSPLCVNPNHLFLGTADDNAKDCVLKGRQNTGTKNGRSILTEEQVIQIRKEKQELKASNKSLGIKYNVSAAVINHIVKRTTWRHL